VFLAFSWCSVSAQEKEPDWSKVELKVTKVSGNIYMLEGQGGNIAASVGEDDIVIVDDEFTSLAEKSRPRSRISASPTNSSASSSTPTIRAITPPAIRPSSTTTEVDVCLAIR